jgi:hypothetical protein
MRESVIEKYLVDCVAKQGGEAIKVGHSSWPDRVVVLPGGVHGWAELKRPGERARRAQELRIERLQGLGCTAGVCASLGAVDAFLQGLCRGREG